MGGSREGEHPPCRRGIWTSWPSRATPPPCFSFRRPWCGLGRRTVTERVQTASGSSAHCQEGRAEGHHHHSQPSPQPIHSGKNPNQAASASLTQNHSLLKTLGPACPCSLGLFSKGNRRPGSSRSPGRPVCPVLCWVVQKKEVHVGSPWPSSLWASPGCLAGSPGQSL